MFLPTGFGKHGAYVVLPFMLGLVLQARLGKGAYLYRPLNLFAYGYDTHLAFDIITDKSLNKLSTCMHERSVTGSLSLLAC